MDLDEELELKIEYTQVGKKIVVNIAFSQDRQSVEYNPADSSGYRVADAPLITINIPLHNDLQDLYLVQGKTLAEIADMVAKDEEDFHTPTNGVLQPIAGLYGIFIETNGVIEAFKPNVEADESIEVVDLGNDVVGARVRVGHTCVWYSALPAEIDADEDGLTISEDCDDTNKDIGGCTTYYRDPDSDGYGDKNDSKCLCGPDGEYTATKYKKKKKSSSGASLWPIYGQLYGLYGGLFGYDYGLYSGNLYGSGLFSGITYESSWLQPWNSLYSMNSQLWSPYSYTPFSYSWSNFYQGFLQQPYYLGNWTPSIY